MTANKVFLDATALIALAMPRDQHHVSASALMEEVLSRGIKMARPKLRPTVVAALEDCERDPLVEIIPLSEELFNEGFSFFRQHADKSWGLTDCISFVVMRRAQDYGGSYRRRAF